MGDLDWFEGPGGTALTLALIMSVCIADSMAYVRVLLIAVSPVRCRDFPGHLLKECSPIRMRERFAARGRSRRAWISTRSQTGDTGPVSLLYRREEVSFPPEDVDTPERFVEIFRSAPRR